MPEGPFRVVVLSCGTLGVEIATRLAAVPAVSRLTLVTTPYRQPRRTLVGKVRHVWRTQGAAGFARILAARLGLRRARAAGVGSEAMADLPPRVERLRFSDFHAPDCLSALRALSPDLGVLAGTYILREAVFGIPRLGSINLHSGKAPEYRGAAPGFWELYNGEREVGITIHRVTEALDAGHVLLQECFALDPCPPEDPLAYLERFRREVLRPNGVRLVVEAVGRIAAGVIQERAQDPSRARTFRYPDRAAIRELRRRVAARRAGRTA